MINYYLEDADANTFPLNDASVSVIPRNSLALSSDSFEWESDVIEKTYQDGATQLGDVRLQSRNLKMSYVRTNPNSSEFQDDTNELIAFVKKTKYIVDADNDRRILVSPKSFNVNYESGTYKKYSNDSASFICLNPYWEDVTEVSITGSALGTEINNIVIDNDGALKTSPVIELTSITANAEVQIYISDSFVGLIIDDTVFGTLGYETMTIDFQAGDITIQTLRRNTSIRSGTGFFFFPQGSFQISILPAEDTDYDIKYRRRYYI